MATDRQRIDNLEADILELKAAIRIAGAFTIGTIRAALDQMVDERLLPAATRTEIFGRIRSDLGAIRIGSENLANGASAAIPHYRTKAEAEELKQLLADQNERETRIRKEILGVPSAKPDGDPGPS